MRTLLVLIALAGIGAGVFFWRQSEDYRTRLEGLTADLTTANESLAKAKAFEDEANALDRAFARGLNAQDAITREFAKLTTPPEQAELRASIEARLAKLKADLEPVAKNVRAKLLELEPPDYTLDASKITDEANAAFLARIDADPAYTKTASGLRYKPIKTVASGRQPTPANEVTVHYKGTFIEGTEFDSSYKRNEPATFPLGNLITGWVEGIPLMKIGETYEFVLPYDLAYGIAGRGSIPPRQTLVFQVELISVADAPPPPP
jgi:FKBP-type peptidyl-prolyl cis-trans isomerase FkpA